MAKHPTSVDKLRALGAAFDDWGVPEKATRWEEDFICDLLDSLHLAEEAGLKFFFRSDNVEEKVINIYKKYQDYLLQRHKEKALGRSLGLFLLVRTRQYQYMSLSILRNGASGSNFLSRSHLVPSSVLSNSSFIALFQPCAVPPRRM